MTALFPTDTPFRPERLGQIDPSRLGQGPAIVPATSSSVLRSVLTDETPNATGKYRATRNPLVAVGQ